MTERVGPELVIGLVAPVGIDLKLVASALHSHLLTVDYDATTINLIELLKEYELGKDIDQSRLDTRYNRRIEAGDKFREILGREDALALLAMAAIREERAKYHKTNGGVGEQGGMSEAQKSDLVKKPVPRFAFILHSLKTVKEVETLRATYGKNFVLVAAYSPRHLREKTLAIRVAESYHDASNVERYKPRALELIYRDEVEHGLKFGQKLSETFPLADVFIDASTLVRVSEGVSRFIDLLFGHPFHTPNKSEFAMFQAYGAGLRSSSAGRQVGAAISTPKGDVIVVGTNEVAKAYGGQYWSDDGAEEDRRDHTRKTDSTTKMVDSILADLFARLKKKGWLNEDKASKEVEELVPESRVELLKAFPYEEEGRETLHQKAMVLNALEFFRPVHAEMAALMLAAQKGFPVDGCVLYTTTFPCHECAKHIVASGISKVVFIEPYPKSRVTDLFDDSIYVDGPRDRTHISFEAFVGIAPLKYVDLFTAPRRKSENGAWVDWEVVKRKSVPRLAQSHLTYLYQESDLLSLLDRLLTDKEIKNPPLPEERYSGKQKASPQ